MKCNAPSIPNVSELLNGALRRNVIFDSSKVIYGKRLTHPTGLTTFFKEDSELEIPIISNSKDIVLRN